MLSDLLFEPSHIKELQIFNPGLIKIWTLKILGKLKKEKSCTCLQKGRFSLKKKKKV